MSVAIRAITRLQDADDLNVTLGAGVEEYALCWDNDTAKFVLRAVAGGGVTDHGALTGLSDDDHSQYLLATGARTGASSQAQVFSSGIVASAIKPASDSTTALQLQNAAGTSVLNVDTTNGRVGIGTTTPKGALDINGVLYLPNLAQIDLGTAWGTGKLYFNNGGDTFGYWGTTGLSCDTGMIAADDNTPNTPAYRFRDSAGMGMYMAATNELAFSANSIERVRINSVGVGIGTPAPETRLHGLLTSSATNTVTNIVTIGHDTSGTAAAGFGAGQLFALESSTTAAQSAARIQALWYEATHATRKADLVLTAFDTAEREGLRIRGAGSAAAIGFFGHAPSAQPSAYTPSNVSADRAFDADTVLVAELADVVGTLIADLQTLGLIA